MQQVHAARLIPQGPWLRACCLLADVELAAGAAASPADAAEPTSDEPPPTIDGSLGDPPAKKAALHYDQGNPGSAARDGEHSNGADGLMPPRQRHLAEAHPPGAVESPVPAEAANTGAPGALPDQELAGAETAAGEEEEVIVDGGVSGFCFSTRLTSSPRCVCAGCHSLGVFGGIR